MKYTSTRDSSVEATFEEALCSGYAADGGLYVPASLPQVSATTLREWAKLSYPDLTYELLRLFISQHEVNDASLRKICASSLQGFVDPDKAVPVHKVGNLYMAELFHGPTHCFKDLGMRGVINLLSHFASQRGRRISLLVATTGDTGPAAVQAVSDVNNPLLTLVVHYPDGQISNFQRKQLTTVQSPCVKVVAFEGGGDDMDIPIKRILSSSSSRQSDSSLGSLPTLYTGVNSYNIGRPIMQMVHYIWTYLRVMEKIGKIPGDPDAVLDIIVPTGAMGNLGGGYMCACMGIPIGKFVAAVNVNDITHRLFQTGAFHRAETMHRTLSEAINIQVPYNAERLLYYLTGCNSELIRKWYHQMDATQKLDLPGEWLVKLQQHFASARVTDEQMCATLRRVQETHAYLADPHTAVALDAARQLGYNIDRGPNVPPAVILSTASPCKFEESVTVAVGSNVWQTYVASNDFPVLVQAVLAKHEIAPIRYRALETLEASQLAWERQAREILASLEKL